MMPFLLSDEEHFRQRTQHRQRHGRKKVVGLVREGRVVQLRVSEGEGLVMTRLKTSAAAGEQRDAILEGDQSAESCVLRLFQQQRRLKWVEIN